MTLPKPSEDPKDSEAAVSKPPIKKVRNPSDLTKEQLARVLPPKLRSAATQELADKINQCVKDPIVADQIKENFITYANVLKDGKYKTENYLDAVTYVSHKLMGYNNREAYEKTFPDRIDALLLANTPSSQISSYVAAYHRGKLVNAIMERSVIPTWILNQDIYQKAINTQADLMINSSSDKVRSDAANSLLTHLKRPEAQDINLNLGVTENTGMRELTETLREMAQLQQKTINAGVSTRDVAAEPLRRIVDDSDRDELIEAEYKEID